MNLWVSYKKKYEEKKFCYILKVPEERSRIRSWIRIRIHYSEERIRGSRSWSRILIRNKMSRILNTVTFSCFSVVWGLLFQCAYFRGLPHPLCKKKGHRSSFVIFERTFSGYGLSKTFTVPAPRPPILKLRHVENDCEAVEGITLFRNTVYCAPNLQMFWPL